MATQGLKLADVFLALGLDDKAYQEGLKRLETEGDKSAKKVGASFTSQLREAFKNPTKYSGDSVVANLVADIRAGIPLAKSLTTAAGGVGTSLKGVGTTVENSVNRALTKTRGLLGGIGSDIAKGFSIGAGIGGFQALGQGISDLIGLIPSLIERGKQYGLVVDEISDVTGATSVESSKLAATLLYLGAPVGSLTQTWGQMARLLADNKDKLHALNIETEDANGGSLNQIQILQNARKVLSQYGDGIEKSQIITQTFGRGGLKIMTDFLKLTDEQIKVVVDDAERMGLILPESVRNLAEAAQRESNRFQNALTGLGVALFTTVGPQISAFFSNLTDSIVAHADEIAQAISGVISYITGLVGELVGLGNSTDFFSASLKRGDAVASPYSARIAELTTRLLDLKGKQKDATGSTDAQREAITRQIDVIEREIKVLQRQDAAQDTVFKRAIAGLARVYQLRLDGLDLAERERENLAQQRDLNEQLNDAQLALAEAQRGKGGKVNAEDVSSAMAKVGDIQRQQAELAHRTEVDAQKASLGSTRDYIESIGKLLESAENKKAALNTLRRREAVLAARQQAQLAAGDTGGAADTGARLEAVKTAETRAQEEIRNGVRQTALEQQKTQLEEVRSAIKSVSVDSNAAAIKETETTLAELDKRQKAWLASNLVITEDGKKAFRGLAQVIRGDGKDGGLVAAEEEARLKGIQTGKDIRAAFVGEDGKGGVLGAITTLGDALGHLFDGLTEAWNALPDPFKGVLAGVLAGGAVGGVPGAIVGAATGGAIQLGALNASNEAERKQVVADAEKFAGDPKTSLAELQAALTGIAAEKQQRSRGAGGPALDPVYDQLLTVLRNAIVSRFGTRGPGHAAGGWAGQRGPELSWLGEEGRELVFPHQLSEKLASFLSAFDAPRMVPAMAGGWSDGSGGVPPHSHDIYMDGDKVADAQQPRIERRLADKRRI